MAYKIPDETLDKIEYLFDKDRNQFTLSEKVIDLTCHAIDGALVDYFYINDEDIYEAMKFELELINESVFTIEEMEQGFIELIKIGLIEESK